MPDKTNISTANRREFIRVIPDRLAPVRVDINGEGFIEVTNAVDISEGGIRISVRHRFTGCHVDLPAAVIIYLPPPIARHFSARGRIRHVLGDSFGVQFISLNPIDRALVRDYVERAVKKEAPAGNFFGLFRKMFGLAP
ncbi:PilZ domain-containing protein [Noviherbaspirillum sedimenti]|uniref:PilZ domain-containing protein n=1 Tax=Noviherbaspirillum sedimenti TaxID=2320865 RepID=A0A3A3G5A1_9BURK|nr:PilZ domain-containing protein [Noviherbaspirillum sedimenti]RJG02855.1 PilZ domain-containing protein [Noviherbaspirillum sedimenti]